MNILFHASFSINETLKTLVTDKIEKLERLQPHFSQADVFFKLKEGKNAPNDKEIEFKFQVPGKVLFAKSHADAYEKAIPEAIEKIRKQLIKYKASK